MEVLKIVVSAMIGFRRFIRQYWSCMLPYMLDELLLLYIKLLQLVLNKKTCTTAAIQIKGTTSGYIIIV